MHFSRVRVGGKTMFSSSRKYAWNNSAPTGRIFMKFYVCGFFEKKKTVLKVQVSLISDKNIGYFT
jgi:hypothetical protein